MRARLPHLEPLEGHAEHTAASLHGLQGVGGQVHGHLVQMGRIAGHCGVSGLEPALEAYPDRKSTRLNSSHVKISYAVFCLKKKKNNKKNCNQHQPPHMNNNVDKLAQVRIHKNTVRL